MPPKKAKPPKEELMSLVGRYGIKFEGPVPPRKWPTQYKHLFQVPRSIWANRYDDFIERTDIDPKTIWKQRKRVRDLCIDASKLRKDNGVNEMGWRDLVEKSVIRRFDLEVIWLVAPLFLKTVPHLFPVSCHCEKENWESEYQAQPLKEDEKVTLKRKRKNRRRCDCDDTHGPAPNNKYRFVFHGLSINSIGKLIMPK
jgi:hypothetical protein